ncbi:MAG: serine protease [Candidatus Pacebacteria bacterium]|nr:serine protease [Candidatus Paceibacterota bacterium]
MDIKDLNKSQLILLAVLLSFITSIATGITTVTLMQEAPVSFTAPVNRIIKQTVENIVQVPGNNTTQTVVIKEEDLVVDAVAKNKSAVFSISKDFDDLNGQRTEISLGSGFAINKDGTIVADALWVPTKDAYFVKNSYGKFKAELLSINKGVAYMKIGEPVDGTSVATYTVPTTGDFSKMKIGQKILILGNTISSFIFDGTEEFKLNVQKNVTGGLVINLDGEALGIAISGDTASFVPMTAILEYFQTTQSKI